MYLPYTHCTLQFSILEGNFNLVVGFKQEHDDSNMIQQTFFHDDRISAAALEPAGMNDKLQVQNISVSLKSPSVDKCLQVQFLCIEVRQGINATYKEAYEINNEICLEVIPLSKGGAGQLQCSFSKLIYLVHCRAALVI